MKFLDLKYDIFGLNVNGSSIKIVKLKNNGRGFALTSTNEQGIEYDVIQDGVIEKEDVLAEAIKSSINSVVGKKIKTKYVVASLPEEESFLQIIQMPKMTRDELATALPIEASNYIPLPIDDVYLDFEVLSPIKNYISHLEVLITAVPKKIVDSYVSCLKKAGLIPLAFELESAAIARAVIKNGNKTPTLIIDFGEEDTNLIIFSGSSVRFTSSIPIGSQLLTKAIADNLDINFKSAEELKKNYGLEGMGHGQKAEKLYDIITPILIDLANQITKYLNFYKDHSSYEYLLGNVGLNKVLFCGGGSELKGLVGFMQEKISLTVELGDPLINFSNKKVKKSVHEELLSSTAAIGLALKKIDSNFIGNQ